MQKHSISIVNPLTIFFNVHFFTFITLLAMILYSAKEKDHSYSSPHTLVVKSNFRMFIFYG